ncbi:hypothetical protein HCH54_009741 [Aspergillus fumigatus]
MEGRSYLLREDLVSNRAMKKQKAVMKCLAGCDNQTLPLNLTLNQPGHYSRVEAVEHLGLPEYECFIMHARTTQEKPTWPTMEDKKEHAPALQTNMNRYLLPESKFKKRYSCCKFGTKLYWIKVNRWVF